MKTELVSYLCCIHCIGKILLLVGKDQQHSISQLILEGEITVDTITPNFAINDPNGTGFINTTQIDCSVKSIWKACTRPAEKLMRNRDSHNINPEIILLFNPVDEPLKSKT